jgi:hypothetical protein
MRRLKACSEYSFNDQWRVEGAVEDVAELFFDTQGLGQWWPQLSGIVIENPGDESAAERTGATQARGFMPYVLQLDFHVLRADFPREFAVAISGDFRGQGSCRFRQEARYVLIDMDLNICVTRPLLRVLSVVARPILVAQHHYVMQRGEIGLRRALARRQYCASAMSL